MKKSYPAARRMPLVHRRVFVAACALAAAVVGGAFFLPDRIEVEETVRIAAPRTVVYDRIAQLPRWEEWGPWFHRDAFVDTTYETPPGGRGSVMTWRHRDQGTGRIKITGQAPPESLALAFDLRDTGDAGCSLTFQESGPDATEVRCRFTVGLTANLSRRWFGLLVRPSVRRLVRDGLDGLRQHCESLPRTAPPA